MKQIKAFQEKLKADKKTQLVTALTGLLVLAIIVTAIAVPMTIHNKKIKNETVQVENVSENIEANSQDANNENSADNASALTQNTENTSAPDGSVETTAVQQNNDSKDTANTTPKKENNKNQNNTEDKNSKPTPNPNPTPAPEPDPTPRPPQKHVAGKGDEAAVASKVIEYINEFRVKEGNKPAKRLTGKTESYLKIRSKQLTTNFAHNTKDERNAAAQIKYGEYINPSEWGDTSRAPYYQPKCTEAISCGGSNGYTIDEVAKSIAVGLKNSQGHWNYIGAVKYPYENNNYIAIGITYVEHDKQFGMGQGVWYCDVATMDSDEAKYDS